MQFNSQICMAPLQKKRVRYSLDQ